jgi:tRNA 2-thiouridine synthesizing protein E
MEINAMKDTKHNSETVEPEFDNQGYLVDYTVWTPELGKAIAEKINLEMTDKHWQMVEFSRQEYLKTRKLPSRRKIVAEFCADPQELFVLFPGSPMRKISKIAGLPKPKNCL